MTAPRSLVAQVFSRQFYLQTYPDVAESEFHEAPLRHFLQHGRHQGRFPSAGVRSIAGALARRSQISSSPLGDVVGLFPESRRRDVAGQVVWKRLRTTVHPHFYAAQTGDDREPTAEEAFEEFLAHGAFEGMRASALFHEDWYLQQLEDRSIPLDDAHPFFHWLTVGWDLKVVPTPVFDEEFYLSRHPGLARWKKWPFAHYLMHGCYEPSRRPSAAVTQPRTAQPDAKLKRRPLIVDQMLGGTDTVHPEDLRRSTPLERSAALMARKVARLQRPVMQHLVAQAAAIEPLVMRPYGPREANWPPVKHVTLPLRDRAEAIRASLPAAQFDTIVLAPHCRMAGSARVTGTLTHALHQIAPDRRVLLLTTDLSDFERPDWFNENVTVLDVSQHAASLGPEHKIRLLLDVVRGLAPARVVNVNSKLGWDLFRLFGRQLSATTELSAYLFTWDLDAHGNKGGYPITYFQECFASLSWVVLDNAALRDELIERYALSRELQRKLVVAYTPVPAVPIDHSDVFEHRRLDGQPLRAFWAGRFDRQKRFDVLVAIAERMPELEILAWGKAVLGGLGVDFGNLPANIRLQGTYAHFDELPVDSCDFFLYTSEWDGLPTILLDAGARGIATVASSVGGVGEVITEHTAFPVLDALNPRAYVATIQQMIANPSEVTLRAKALRAHVHELCSDEAYVDVLRPVFGDGAAPAAPASEETG